MSQKKRFIAGAQCPQCKQLDTIVVFQHGEIQQRQCVDCDFVEQLQSGGQAEQELPTRVNQAPAEKIKFIE